MRQWDIDKLIDVNNSEAVDMNGRFQMQGGKNWFLPKEMNANRFFWDSHWLEIWSNHFYPSMGPNGGSVAMDSVLQTLGKICSLYVYDNSADGKKFAKFSLGWSRN